MTMINDPGASGGLSLNLSVTLRPARHEDIPKLEWYGQYRHYRNLFQRAFREQQAGRRLILVADCNDFPIGQIAIQFEGNAAHIADGQRRGYLYSFRVMEMFRGQGLGTRLIADAEQRLLAQGFTWATIAVAKDNPAAQRLYERLGYVRFAEDPGRWTYVDHRGTLRQVDEPCWILEKSLRTE